MKALLFITGRGLGGDATIALNIANGLVAKSIDCELVLDPDAPGILFEKNGWSWHKLAIPQAGGHAATKANMAKAGFKTLKSGISARNLIKKTGADVVVGIIGGGAVIGCLGAKFAGVPAIGIVNTPQDVKICSKLNKCIILPEIKEFKLEKLPSTFIKSYFPLKHNLNEKNAKGDSNIAIENINQKIIYNNISKANFDKNNKSVLFSSGSSLFEKMAEAAGKYAKENKNKNVLVLGHFLDEKYSKYLEGNENLIYLGYIDWIKDLYDLVDLAVLTDDGIMIQEAIVANLPIIALLKAKYGRYHNMGSIYPEAVIESDINDISQKTNFVLDNINEFKDKTNKYKKDLLSANSKIIDAIIEIAKSK